MNKIVKDDRIKSFAISLICITVYALVKNYTIENNLEKQFDNFFLYFFIFAAVVICFSNYFLGLAKKISKVRKWFDDSYDEAAIDQMRVLSKNILIGTRCMREVFIMECELGKYKEAQKTFFQIHDSIHKKDYEVKYYLAEIEFISENWYKTIEILSSIPNDHYIVNIYIYLAISNFKLSNYSEAKDQFFKALDEDNEIFNISAVLNT